MTLNPGLWSCTAWTVAILCFMTEFSSCSRGDRDYTFYECLQVCKKEDCNGLSYKNQSWLLECLGWDCDQECKYECMWKTVELFQNHQIEIPQFYGKWPFVRLLGIQEPASVLASILNLITHVYGIAKIRKNVPNDAPLYWFWQFFAGVCLNGWICSTVFHTRDTPTTELLDYFSAFSMVLFSLLAGVVRIFEKVVCFQVIGIAVLFFAFLLHHIHYLTFIHFDYSYNMKVNIGTGILNASIWLIWCAFNRKKKPHVRKCALFIILAVSSILLEVGDFRPVLWVLDAHALWHFSTALISPLWYRFVIDDCLHMQHQLKTKMV